jgi:hypothetical protein
LALKSPNIFFIWYLGDLSNTRCSSSYKLSFTSPISSSVGEWTLRTMIWHQRPLIIIMRQVHKVSFPLAPQLANLILREATAHTW